MADQLDAAPAEPGCLARRNCCLLLQLLLLLLLMLMG
jgi:hypothetical protein